MNNKLKDNIFDKQSADPNDPKAEAKKKIIQYAKDLVFDDIEIITKALKE